MAADVGPFRGENAVHHDIARAPIATDAVVSNDTVLLGAECFDGALGAKVEVVGAQTDHLAAERVEGVSEQQQLAGGVDVCALATAPVPGVTNFDAINGQRDVVIASRDDDHATRYIAHMPWQHGSAMLASHPTRVAMTHHTC